jgi:hypothetical protein
MDEIALSLLSGPALIGIGPKDELEGMMAAQLIAVMRVLLVFRLSRARPLVERHGTGNTSRICADRRPARARRERCGFRPLVAPACSGSSLLASGSSVIRAALSR